MDLILSASDIKNGKDEAKMFKCPTCGSNAYQVDFHNGFQIFYFTCIECGNDFILFKEGDKNNAENYNRT